MKIRWQKLLINVSLWAIAEITLNIVELDTIADYSEFLEMKEEMETVISAIAYT
ncbi:conserved hypothetical protein [Hyella patelloides LEGE 07179]|uniref:Uncharacterized protein n=1 Tax=Hyella patelloides LEGE 07179 TaxID=945734 RepID=A0A563VP74_9CYAN|nr:hypothetical protein [Hyella patelloides]VEP13220.1 conserved hypothetical protein [Hyella patelloides LEGE 07179]